MLGTRRNRLEIVAGVWIAPTTRRNGAFRALKQWVSKMALPQKLLLSFAAVIVCGSSVFALPARVATSQVRPVLAPVPEPVPLPCRQQHWTNADRICLTWTRPRDGAHQATTTVTGNGSLRTQGG
jgi:hypothetical protein